MGKASRKKYGTKENAQPIPLRAAPNWILFGLALVGMGLTAYLTFSTWKGQSLAGCAAGSGCDVVLSSQWSRLFGLPTSLWGFLAYGALAAAAFVKRADVHWKLAWGISLFGFLFSVYLTVIALAQLKSACPYCLSSLVLMTAILGVTTYQRPAALDKFSWTSWIVKTVPAALVLILFAHLNFAGVLSGGGAADEDSSLGALAQHLAKIDAKFYGASWCPHCKDQKKMFGAAAERLPYVECSPQGPSGPQAPICRTMNIKGYPTWIINGRRFEGVLTTQDLAQYSGFQGKVQ